MVTLRDGHRLPSLGLGTWPLNDADAEATVHAALCVGYRLIDTASSYGNERGVGRGLLASDVPREAIALTTKLRGSAHGYDETLHAFERSLQLLSVDYIDLYLIHWPLPVLDRYVATWRAFRRLQEEGLVRSIGVSNFLPEHIERLGRDTGVWPAINQIEIHPGYTQESLRAWCVQRGIVVQGWSPLGEQSGLLDDAVILELARLHQRSPAQVVLRWHLQMGVIPLPKSACARHLAENLDLNGFSLVADELGLLSDLERSGRLGGEPTTHLEF